MDKMTKKFDTSNLRKAPLPKREVAPDRFSVAEESPLMSAADNLVKNEPKQDKSAINIANLIENPLNPRYFYNQSAIDDMGASLKDSGQLTPITVVENPDKSGSYIVIDGHYRWKGAESAGISELKCDVIVASQQEMYTIGRTINEVRNEQTVFDDALGFKKTLEAGVFKTHLELSNAVKKPREYVTKVTQLSELPDEYMEAIIKVVPGIAWTMAYAILGLYKSVDNHGGDFSEVLNKILNENWSKGRIELYAKNMGLKSTPKDVKREPGSVFFGKSGKKLGQISRNGKKIDLKFTAEDLDMAEEIESIIKKALADSGFYKGSF